MSNRTDFDNDSCPLIARRSRFGCSGCDAAQPWLRDSDGGIILSGSVRQHVTSAGDLVPCENQAIRKDDEQLWARRWLR